MRYACTAFCSAVLLCCCVSPVEAIDIVVRRSTGQREGGTISKMSKTDVTVTKTVGGDTVVPVNDIAVIEFDSAPASMGLGRSALEAGQLDVAQKQLETALQESAAADKPGLKGDLEFMLARVFALRAQANPAQAGEATKRLGDYLSKNRDHYRFFDAQLLLGEVALQTSDAAAATTAFTAVASAPWKDFQMAAQIGQGRTFLLQQNVDGAKREFDAVAAVQPQDDAQKSRQLQGLLGQATCQKLKDQHQQAIDTLDKVIDGSSGRDFRLQAEAYILQGDCFTAMGSSPKDAIMAYLHVDVIPAMARESDLHAQALYNLARLWNQVGQTDRAREAADLLRGQYPESDWAKKLGG